MLVGKLEAEFAEMNGYEAESEAAVLLKGLGIAESLLEKKMKDLDGGDKVRVLLAQALYGNPDVLLLDEPTNHLDLKSIAWLEEFLCRFANTVIVVSHDRHFLNQVCTHIADIDFGKIQVYLGNYDFWYGASQLILKQKQNENRKAQEKADDLKQFIQRFSANASKSRQATSRKKLLEKLTIEDMPISSRKYPFISFKPARPCGNTILEIQGLSKAIQGVDVLNDLTLMVRNGDRIAFVGSGQPGQDNALPDPGRGVGAGQRQFSLGADHHLRLFPQGSRRLLPQRPDPHRLALPVSSLRQRKLRQELSRADALFGG